MVLKVKDDAGYTLLSGAMTGEEYRQWLALFHDEAAGFTDESGSSLSDTFNDVDMGGGAAGAIPMPPGGGVAGNAHLDKMTRRARCARRTHTACWLVPSGTPT